MTVRRNGARLAVLLITIGLGGCGGLLGAVMASADDGCVMTPRGIDCGYRGRTTTTRVRVLPPIRYLGTSVHPVIGTCWYWSRYPPGYDSWDSAFDQSIILTRHWYPECPRPGTTVVNVASRAWTVFRSFPLRSPEPRLRPTIGITNLESILTMGRPTPLDHRETLPDGRVLEVQAFVDAIRVDWGDGTPEFAHPAGPAFADGIPHAYVLKTCPPAYRTDHLLGPNCHPLLERYPVDVAFAWTGRYRTGGAWIVLGTLDRTVRIDYDVDEVVGVPSATGS